MGRPKLLLDTNIVIDFLNQREPFYEPARLLMIAGRVGEFDLYLSASQMTDLVYILSNGGRASEVPHALERLRKLRMFVQVLPTSAREVDLMLASSWSDPEDCLLSESAAAHGIDAIITRNGADFEKSLVPVFDCQGYFEWLEATKGISYREVPL